MSSPSPRTPETVIVPSIETGRLKLRGHRPDDFVECAAMWADPAVTRYIGGKPSTAEEVWSRILRYAGLWVWMGFGYWAIEEKATGRFIGELGFADFKRDIELSLEGIPELGWALASHAHGRGYATEAMRAVVAWSDARLTAAQTACLIHPDNLRSIRVAEKNGYQMIRQTTYKEQPTAMFTRQARQ